MTKPYIEITSNTLLSLASDTFVLLNLESPERKEKNYANLNILRIKGFLDEIKSIFHSF